MTDEPVEARAADQRVVAVICEDPELYARAYNEGYKDARDHLGDLDFNADDGEQCEACIRLEDLCAFHQGIECGLTRVDAALARVEQIKPVGSPDWVASGYAMRTTVLREIRAAVGGDA